MRIASIRRLWLIGSLLLGLWPLAQAHTMWLETAREGRSGHTHRIELYFGEFSMADKTRVDKWLKGMESGHLELLTPRGQVQVLALSASDSCYSASFVPDQEGWYRITYDCLVPTLWQGTRLHYQSVAWVRVGSPSLAPERTSPFGQGLSLLPHELTEGAFSMPVAHISGSLNGIKLSIQGDNGWSRNVYRYPEGKLAFTPLWPGRYLISSVAKQTYTAEQSAQHGGAKGLYDMITYFVQL